MTITLATVFSGIGAVEQAFIKQKIPYKLCFACDNGERYLESTYEELLDEFSKSNNNNLKDFIKLKYEETKKNNYVKASYFANYDIDEDRWYDDIRFLDGKVYKDTVDILVGGSPCQSFSIIGKKAGLDDARGTLFYDFARLVSEIQPKAFIFENVTGMLSHDKGNTWKVINEIFNSLNYKVEMQILNSKDFGIPQDRKRIFVVGFRNQDLKFNFPKGRMLDTTLFDYLENQIPTKYYLGKKGFEFVTNPKYKNRARINKDVIQTQKANQQFNWNGDFIFEELDEVKHNSQILERAYVGEYEGKKGVIRQLTCRECLRLMGFSDDFKIVVPNTPAYRQSGNSIVVNILESLVLEVINTLGLKGEVND